MILFLVYEKKSCFAVDEHGIFSYLGDMRKTERPEIDWLGLSPRAMARVMELSEQLKITPKKAFELMVAEAATQGADVKEASASRKKLKAGTVA